MTRITKIKLPLSEAGKDPNDRRDDPTLLDDIKTASSEVLAEYAAPEKIPLDGDLLTPYEWVIDDFMYAGTMTVSGSYGVGKTSALIPLSLAVVGATTYPGVVARVPRQVLYFAEDVDQAKRLLHGSIQELGADREIIRQRLTLQQAHRRNVDDYKAYLSMLEDMSETVATPNGPVKVCPLIVFDTASACFQLVNENDNAEVASTIARLREIFRGYPVWIITHVAKAVSREDVLVQSSRGATAWEADVQGVFRLFEDGDGTRVLYGGKGVKRRDCGALKEVVFNAVHHMEGRDDIFGNRQIITYLAVKVRSSTEDARKAHIAEAKEAEERIAAEAILKYLRKQLDLGIRYSKTSLAADKNSPVGDKRARPLVSKMIDDGRIEVLPLPKDECQGSRTTYLAPASEVPELTGVSQ